MFRCKCGRNFLTKKFQNYAFKNKFRFALSGETTEQFMHIAADGQKYCTACSYSTRKKTDLHRHIEASHLETEYPCPHCSHVLKTEITRKRHIKAKHFDLEIVCPNSVGLNQKLQK